jgi:hypothetical protein
MDPSSAVTSFVASVEVRIFSVITQYSWSALPNPMEFAHIGWCSSMNKKNTNKVFECKGCCRNNFIWSFPLHSITCLIYTKTWSKTILYTEHLLHNYIIAV